MNNRLLKTAFILLFSLFVTANAVCHSDSLWTLWSNTNNHDTIRLKALDAFIHHNNFSRTYPDSALRYAEMLLNHASSSLDSLYILKAHTLKGMLFHQKGNPELARQNFNAALNIQQATGDVAGAANSLNRIGVTYRATGKYRDAISHYAQSLKLQRLIGDSIGVARSLLNISNCYNDQGDFQLALKYARPSLKIVAHEEEHFIEATVWNNLGIIYNNLGRIDSAIYAYKQGLDIRVSLEDANGIAVTHYNLGIIHYDRGQYELAIENFNQSLAFFEEQNDFGTAAQVLNALGVASRNMGDHRSSINYNHRALRLREKSGDRHGIGQSYVNLGLIHHDQNDYDRAMEYCLKGLSIFEELEAKQEIGETHVSIGDIAFKHGELDVALHHFEKSLAIYQEIGYRKGESTALHNIGLVNRDKGNRVFAMECFEKSIQISEELENFQRIAHPLTSMAMLLLDDGKYLQARALGEKALKHAENHGSIEQIRDAANQLYLTNKLLGDARSALEMHELYILMRDSLLSKDNIKQLAKFEFQYAYEKKALADSLHYLAKEEASKLNHSILLAQKETERNLYASGGLFMIFITFLFYQRKVNKNKLMLKEKEAAYQQELIHASIKSQEQERRRIAQDLHDEVGAMLSTIRLQLSAAATKLAHQDNPVIPAVNMVDETITNVRRISKDLLPPTLEKFGLTHALNELADKVSEATGITIQKELPTQTTRMELERELALYRVIQEMMNNAMKHAEATTFNLRLKEENGNLHLTFSDNGKGFDINALQQSRSGQTGLGLKNLENRVGLAGGEMTLTSAPGKGTRIDIALSKHSIGRVA
ncbi:MAG: hypothetical protein EA392_03520 [Cryomorphaceae bacterium]|nr:MAG: hypothetical protein EA392_03520 [Cryomorphaceae bacterium]